MSNLNFYDAFGDAIDIDVCDRIEISNSKFFNSKNDGIDLMESSVNISNVNIFIHKLYFYCTKYFFNCLCILTKFFSNKMEKKS